MLQIFFLYSHLRDKFLSLNNFFASCLDSLLLPPIHSNLLKHKPRHRRFTQKIKINTTSRSFVETFSIFRDATNIFTCVNLKLWKNFRRLDDILCDFAGVNSRKADRILIIAVDARWFIWSVKDVCDDRWWFGNRVLYQKFEFSDWKLCLKTF